MNGEGEEESRDDMQRADEFFKRCENGNERVKRNTKHLKEVYYGYPISTEMIKASNC